jgi:signal transduction histidine kinase
VASGTASSTEPVPDPAATGVPGAPAGPPHVPGTFAVGAGARPPMRTRVAGSVRFRLTVSVVLVVGLSLLGGGALLVRWVEATLINDLKVRNEQILESMAASITRSRVPSEFFAPVDEVGMDDATRQVFGDGADAEEAISTTYFYMDGAIPEYLPGLNSDGELGLFQRQGPPASSRQTVEVTRDIPTADGVITLHAVSSVSDIMRSVGALSAALWLGLPILVVGSGVMTWLITGRTLAPVGVMTRRVRELSATTLDARVPVPPTDDEIAELASTMNEMLDRLQAASVSQRQFVSDASHELRSPVASIRAQLETALQYPDDVDWPSVARIVLAEDARLEHLVGNLLAMARLEEGRLGPRSEIDMDELVMSQTARMTGVQLDLSGVSGGRVWGNPDELTSIVRNLLDNAARHARSTVAVTLRETGPWVVLSVGDDGPGVPPEDRERVFERFARLQEGRSRDQGGTGLGLALSRRVAESHGGRIHVEASPLGGACFVVALPSAGWTGSVLDAPAEAEQAPGAEPPASTSPQLPPAPDDARQLS